MTEKLHIWQVRQGEVFFPKMKLQPESSFKMSPLSFLFLTFAKIKKQSLPAFCVVLPGKDGVPTEVALCVGMPEHNGQVGAGYYQRHLSVSGMNGDLKYLGGFKE